MIITKHKESYIKTNYFFVKGNIPDINYNYFISKIKEGISSESSLNFKTNVVGHMTPFKYFNQDPEFLKLMLPMMDYLDEMNLPERVNKWELQDSWGIKESFSMYTVAHDHKKCVWSGVVYFNQCDQKLIFPQINEEVETKTGNFAIFSSELLHRTDFRVKENQIKYGIAFNFVNPD
tara:strand:- start:89 stop:619 length:531 start_codon:yes stop_codon:yes gene_type:complete